MNQQSCHKENKNIQKAEVELWRSIFTTGEYWKLFPYINNITLREFKKTA